MSVKINIIQGSSKRKSSCPTENPYQGMEAVHHANARSWITPKINLQEHFAKYTELVTMSRYPVNPTPDLKVPNKRLRELMETSQKYGVLSDDIFNECMTNCDIDNFTLSNEMEPQQQFSEVNSKFSKFVPSDIPKAGVKNLKTLEMQKEFLDKATNYERYKRMRCLRNPNNAHFEAAPLPPTRLNLEAHEKEILVAIRVYRPIKSTTKNVAASMTTVNRFVQEIHMLGSNTLSQLRDLIKCPGDYMLSGDVSHQVPSMKSEDITPVIQASKSKRYALEKYKSAFIFIEDCFYNDTRWSDCQDLSEVIRNWASESKRKIGPFQTGVMEKTRIKDLTIRLGYPYVYVHLGDHEHLISFVEARLLSADDHQKLSAYPFERSAGMVHSKMCMVCNTFIAKWITVDNERVPEDPFFFCNDCFRHFNYSPKGEKIGDFKAYPYIDVNAL